MKKHNDWIEIAYNSSKILLGTVVLITLFSYNALDPSFNVASNQIPHNLLKKPGAYFVDLLMQSCGFFGYAIPIIILINPILYFRKIQQIGSINIIIILIITIFLCGGIIGTIMSNNLPFKSLVIIAMVLLFLTIEIMSRNKVIYQKLQLSNVNFYLQKFMRLFERKNNIVRSKLNTPQKQEYREREVFKEEQKQGLKKQARQNIYSSQSSYISTMPKIEEDKKQEQQNNNKLPQMFSNAMNQELYERLYEKKIQALQSEKSIELPIKKIYKEEKIEGIEQKSNKQEVLLLEDILQNQVVEEIPKESPQQVNSEQQLPRAKQEVRHNFFSKIVAPIRSTPIMSTTQIPTSVNAATNNQAYFNKNRKYPPFKLPDINLLSENKGKKIIANHHQARLMADQLVKVLEDFSIYGKILHYHIGPVITLYEFEPLAGTKSSRVIGLCDDIARSLSATSARISVISGKNALGIELPNEHRELVLLKEIITSDEYSTTDYMLPIALGKNISGESIVVDLSKMPHLLVAGTTGSGKSVAVNVMIVSILYALSPDECKFIMIDPKMLELSAYNGIPHLLTPVVTDPKKAVVALKWVVKEMESRYRMMSYLGVRNIKGFNEKITEAIRDNEELSKIINVGFDKANGEPITETIIIEKKKFPYIVVIVDEMADLMLVAGKEIEFYIQRLAQMARAAGIHIVMATQRPSVDVITGVIKANLPTRISFAVTSKIDSRTILGEQGAEQLLGMGDMLYMASGNKVTRVHGPFISDGEVERIVHYLQSFGPPNYLDDITSQINTNPDEDEMNEDDEGDDKEEAIYKQAIALIIKEKKVSISYIQRQLRIGYNKSANIVERMEKEGVVSAPNHQGKRDIIEEN